MGAAAARCLRRAQTARLLGASQPGFHGTELPPGSRPPSPSGVRALLSPPNACACFRGWCLATATPAAVQTRHWRVWFSDPRALAVPVPAQAGHRASPFVDTHPVGGSCCAHGARARGELAGAAPHHGERCTHTRMGAPRVLLLRQVVCFQHLCSHQMPLPSLSSRAAGWPLAWTRGRTRLWPEYLCRARGVLLSAQDNY